MRQALLLSAAVVVMAFASACGNLNDVVSGALQCDATPPTPVSQSAPKLTAIDGTAPRRWVVELGDDGSGDGSNDASTQAPGKTTSALSGAHVPMLRPDDVARIEKRGGRVLAALPQRRISAELSDAQAATLKQDPGVRGIELDPPRFPLAQGGQELPWGIGAIGAPEAWSAAAPLQRGAKVCIIDSGLYSAHEDLSPGGGTRDGFPADSWNQDSCGHGTHVAGTIAALDNGTGVVGANPLGADLYAVRVFGGADCGWTYGSELANAIDRCVDSGAKVINMSLGGFSPSTLERDALLNAWRHGVLVVAAAGNEGDTELEYPASYPVVLSVGAVDDQRKVTAFSQRNPQVDLVAPGAAVVSTIPFVSRHEVSVAGTTVAGSRLDKSQDTSGVSGPLRDGGACDSVGSWPGAVVVCQRGGGTFAEKVRNAQQGGAVAVVVFNNETGSFSGTLGDNPPALPAIAVAGEDGPALLKNAGATATVVNEARREGSGYAAYSGTSMASPHVAGAASFLMGQEPSRSAAEIRSVLLASAQKLGDGDGSGHGLLRADKALALLRSGAVRGDEPLAGFLTHCDGLRCNFTDASVAIEGDILSRTWSFGDGVTQAGAEDTPHAFAQAGTYPVTLTVEDAQGHSASFTVPVSAVSASAHGGKVGADGSREVELDWTGIKTDTVRVLRDGKDVGTSKNDGAVVATMDEGKKSSTWRVCSAGGESCSEELSVLPPCN